MARWIDDRRMVRIQLPQSIDQGKGFRGAGHASLTHRVVPHKGGNVCIEEERSDRRNTGIERKLRSPSEIENAFFGIGGWRVGVKEGPATIKDRLSQLLRDIDRCQIRCAKCRHEQNELEVGHFWIANIKRGHGYSLSGEMSGESTIV